MAKLELQDAYLTVYIFHSYRRFLSFQWRAQAYQSWYQRIRLVQYLDDTLLVAESPESSKTHLRKAANLLEELGLLLNKNKCVWTPTQRVEFLGFKVDLNIMHLYLPPKKVKIRKECKNVTQGHLTVRKVAHLIDLLTSTIPAPLHYRALQLLKGKALRNSHHCYNTVIPLHEDALKLSRRVVVYATGSNGSS